MTQPGEQHAVPVRRQRVSARALLRRGAGDDEEVLLARVSTAGFSSAGTWTLPGGGVDHGEHPEDSLRREVYEETSLEIEVGRVLGVMSRHFTGPSPRGVTEDFHAIHLVYAASIGAASADSEPRVVEVGGTTDRVAWVRVADVRSGRVRASQVAKEALDLL